MNRRCLLTLFTLFGPVLAIAPGGAAAEPDTVRPDAEVLETVLLDLLADPKSPREPRGENRQPLRFSTTRLEGGPRLASVQYQQDPKQWAKLSAAQLEQARQATTDLERRVAAKDELTGFRPKDPKISLYSGEEEKLDQQRERRFQRPQVFRAYPPGYTPDRQLAVVHLVFPWSGGFHSGNSTYVLARKDERWTILLKQFVYYV